MITCQRPGTMVQREVEESASTVDLPMTLPKANLHRGGVSGKRPWRKSAPYEVGGRHRLRTICGVGQSALPMSRIRGFL